MSDRNKGFRGQQPQRQRPHGSGKPQGKTEVIDSKEVNIGSKRFVIKGIKNFRGRALELREYSHGRDNIIVLPLDGADEVMEAMDDVLTKLENET